MIDDPDSSIPAIDAVPTLYHGVTFRSRLEADWAATLDSKGIAWHYEPELITLPSGTLYLPDFWLPEIGTWLEVKGPGIPRLEKTKELAQTRACACKASCSCRWPGGEFVIIGKTSEPSPWNEPGHRPRGGYASWATPLGPSAYFVTCPACRRAQWRTLQRPWRCRACDAPLGKASLYRPIDRAIVFTEAGSGLGALFRLPDLGEPFTEEDLAGLGNVSGGDEDGF